MLANLFKPLRIGPVQLKNRIVMAPLTRLRSQEPGDIPTPLMGEYYRQRASAGLIISEATQVSFEAKGYQGAPGLHTPEQTAAWRPIVESVHDAGGQMAVQLWHTGRISHASLQPGGRAPGAPSAVVAPGTRTSLKTTNGEVCRADTTPPRELTHNEIQVIARDFASTVSNARAAGFDMVEIHGAHGYLIHQFLSPQANLRTDAYGGSVEARMRFALEVVDAAIEAWSADRIGFRTFPLGGFNGIENGEDQEGAALAFIRELALRGIAYLHLSEPDGFGGKPLRAAFREAIREAFQGPIIAAGAYTPDKADDLIERGVIDAVAFGRRFLANPDLPARIASDGPYNLYREAFVYGGGAEGYTDYPTLDAADA